MSKIRICTIYDNLRGRNDGVGLYSLHQFQQMPEIEVVHLVPYGDIREYGTFDVHLWCDWGEDAFPDYLYRPFTVPKPNIYWVSDMHWAASSAKYRIEKAKEFDLVLCNHRQHVAIMQSALGHDRVEWLPFAVEPNAYPREAALKKYDCVFVGHLNTPHRIDFLDTMFKAFPNSFLSYGRVFNDVAQVFHSGKICLNQSVAGDLNMRVFEVLGAGGFLLTDHAEGLSDLFEVGKHLVTYTSYDEAIKKAKYYLEHDEEREAIAEAGHQHALAHHTYRHRCEEMLVFARKHGVLKETHAPEPVVTH